jgi:trehalose 6-phosphate synthase
MGEVPVFDAVQRNLIVAANRGPVQFHNDPLGEPYVTRGPGGLVSVLTELLREQDGTWVAVAVGPDEEHIAASGETVEVTLEGVRYRVRYVAPSAEQYHRYYNIVANPMLWFIQHYLWDLGRHPDIGDNEIDAWRLGYQPVNQLFAAAIAAEIGRDRGSDYLVMLHDYHLYLVAPLVRAACPGVFLHQFVHTPWPQSDAWRVLPQELRQAIFEGLLGNDIVAFHTPHYVANFLQGCETLLDLEIDRRRRTVRFGEREVWVRSYPVSIDPLSLRQAAESQRVVQAERRLLERRRQHLLVRVDRLDLSKNVIRGFIAFDRFLELHPDYKETVTFLALLQPSREDVEEYVTYRERVIRTVEQINTRHGNTDWMPIDLRIQDDFPFALAAYKHYDVLMVNAIYDGMNLVAKEGPLVNTRDGVLILSEHTGAFDELGAFSLAVNPFDIEEQAAAIYRALTMRPEDRHLRAAQLRTVVQNNTIDKWVAAQVADVAAKIATD